MGVFETLGNVAFAAFILADVGAIYQAIASAVDRRRYPPPGRLIEIGNHRLHLIDMGRGGPTVILEAGGGGSSLEWSLVQPELAKYARVVSYDRAGFGWSDPNLKTPTAAQIAEDLHTLLMRADIPGPFILVARSIGGFAARLFAHRYPHSVAGVVLIDAAHEDEPTRVLPELLARGRQDLQLIRFLRFLAPLGLVRFAGYWELLPKLRVLEKVSPPVRAMIESSIYRSLYANTLYSEYAAFEASAALVRKAGTLGDLPLVVLTAERHLDAANYPKDFPIARAQQIWLELQKELAALSERGVHTVVEGSSHYIALDRPEAIVGAVRSLIECAQAKGARP